MSIIFPINPAIFKGNYWEIAGYRYFPINRTIDILIIPNNDYLNMEFLIITNNCYWDPDNEYREIWGSPIIIGNYQDLYCIIIGKLLGIIGIYWEND